MFTINAFDTDCALPAAGRIGLEKVNRAILALRVRGDRQRIHDHYRLPRPAP